ncbi:MAG: DUF975 family protein [Clostridium sp.]|nr:DUF975 family protein [Clostridium sp.]
MNFIEIKEEAKKLTSKHILKFWKSSLLVFASSITLAIILGIISGGVLAFITELLALPLYIGFISYILSLTREEEVSLTDIFQDYKKIGLIVVTLIISYVFIIFGYILLIIPGIMIAFSLVMVVYLLADSKETSISEARNIIRESREMMNGYKLDYFIFELSFIGWHFLGAITFGIAYIYVIPYFTFANTLYYQRLKEKRKS